MEANPTHYDRNNPLLMSAEILLGSLEAAQELGLSVEPSLALAQIDASQLSHPDQFIPLHSVVDFLNDMAERSGCEHFGFLVALKQPPSQFARVGQLVKFAATLGEAIDDAIRFQANDDVWVRISAEDGSTVVEKLMTKGEDLIPPEEPRLMLTTNNAGALSVTVGDDHLKTLGFKGEILENVSLKQEKLLELSMLQQ